MSCAVSSLSRAQKRRVLMIGDAGIIALALWLALAMRLGDIWPEYYMYSARWFFLAVPPIGVIVFYLCGVYNNLLRSLGRAAFLEMAASVIILMLALGAIAFADSNRPIPASTPMIFGFVLFIFASALRILGQSYYRWRVSGFAERIPVLIYGAGETGTRLAATLNEGSKYKPVGFIDDDHSLYKSSINGCCVFRADDIAAVIARHHVKQVFLALPSITSSRRGEILRALSKHDVRVQSVPSMSELIAGFASVDQLREVSPSELLQRETVEPISELVTRSIEGKSVAVTGGGGSIGSEICRQILMLAPKCLVVYEISELALYTVMRELDEIAESMEIDVPVQGVLGSVDDKLRLKDIFAKHRVETVFHAAAYKHVPIVEANVLEGVRNNVLATKIVAEVCRELAIERAVLVSTDKAVRPTNVMGATKRLAEQVFQDAQTDCGSTVFAMVRFGNVMASSGSVIPVFQSQIKNRTPVTVTHPEITRYFMTIQEAAQLVVQAGSLARGGDVFVLDMGPPVRIADLARRMIELSGLEVKDEDNPDGDIEIVYTGLRPGEKLHEELLIDAAVSKAAHPKIFRAVERQPSRFELNATLDGLDFAVRHNDVGGAVQLLRQGVPEYRPDEELLQLVERTHIGTSADTGVRLASSSR